MGSYAIAKNPASLLFKYQFMKRILFMMAPVVLVLLAFRPLTSRIVSGKITDDAGNPLAGAIIQLKGTTTATVSTAAGTYRITVNGKTGTLEFSAIGYESKKIKFKEQDSVINVTLAASGKELQEVVVIGYGTQKKRHITGSVTTISPPAANYGQVGSTPYALQGQTAGISAGKPGNASAIRIRGNATPGVRQPEYIKDFNTEGYDHITENRFLAVFDNPLSTFSIDVDAASYSNVRRFLNQGQLPPAGAVRIEEMVNYFHYDYPQPGNDQPFSINTEISEAPWNKDHKLVLIGLQGKKIPMDALPSSNLVFLVDVSGSMNTPDKLPLVKASLKLLADQLREQDHVAIVVYAGAAGLVLPPANGTEKIKIKDAIDNLEAGGSTAGGAGLRLAYKTARQYFVKGGNNRVILCTDGDFNIGESSNDAMERLVEEERKSGVFLTVLGYGTGNYQDSKMQKLANKGNGNHAYIDGLNEARKVLVNEFGGTLFTIAKDVKLQVEFNPANVQGYRLIGYENRMLAKEDFNDDRKDAGELGSGHAVTALYEIIPAGVKDTFLTKVDDLKYQRSKNRDKSSGSHEMLTIKFRYKAPDGEVSKLIEHPVIDKQVAVMNTSDNFRFAACVAEFGMLLRNSGFRGTASFDDVLRRAKSAKGGDEEGYRSEFIRLVQSAQLLQPGGKSTGDVGKR